MSELREFVEARLAEETILPFWAASVAASVPGLTTAQLLNLAALWSDHPDHAASTQDQP